MMRVDRRQDLAHVAHVGAARAPGPAGRPGGQWAASFAANRSPDGALWSIVDEPPEKMASPVQPVAAAAASTSAANRVRISPEVRLVGAPDHEPPDGPRRNDVRGGAALEHDPVDACVGLQLLAPEGDPVEQHHHRVEGVAARPRLGRRHAPGGR